MRPIDGGQAGRLLRRDDGRAAATQVPGDRRAQADAAQQHGHLNHIGPHHRAHASHGVVDHGDATRQHNRPGQGQAGADLHHQCPSVKGDARGQPAREQEDHAEPDAGAAIKAALQIFVDADQAQAPQHGYQHHHHKHHGQGQHQLVLQPSQPTSLNQGHIGRNADEGIGRRLGGEDGDGQGPPRQVAPAHVVIGRIGLPSGEPGRQAQGGGQIAANDPPIQGRHSRGLGQVVGHVGQ